MNEGLGRNFDGCSAPLLRSVGVQRSRSKAAFGAPRIEPRKGTCAGEESTSARAAGTAIPSPAPPSEGSPQMQPWLPGAPPGPDRFGGGSYKEFRMAYAIRS
jgi:hypothetical protein